MIGLPDVGPQDTPPATRHRIVISAGSAGQRIDRVLADAIPALSRARIKALIDSGQVEVDGATLDAASKRVKPGQVIVLAVPPPVDPRPVGQAIPLDILFEDADLIVVNKPAGLVVHPAPGNPDRTLVNALIHHCGDQLRGIGGVRRPGIVHRLDKDTSGVMVAAKTNEAHQFLAEQFAAHSIERAYLAIVWGVPAPHRSTLHSRIGRSRQNRKKMAIVASGGKDAITHYDVAAVLADGAMALVRCRLETGRTHQIRVHLAAAGHPVLGDRTYGHGRGRRLQGLDQAQRDAVEALGRQALHAFRLGFAHPTTGKRVVFETKLPNEMKYLMNLTQAPESP